jgi:hypothetical protein
MSRTDVELVISMANQLDASEYKVFKEAAREWGRSEGHIDEAFCSYILTDFVPWYVRDYCRKYLEV